MPMGTEQRSLHDAIAQHYNDLAPHYDEDFQSRTARAEDVVTMRWLRRLGLNDATVKRHAVLDVGCGTGLLLDHLSIHPWLYHGVDVSPGMIDRARAKHPDHSFFRTAIEDYRLPQNCYDLIVSLYGSFSHILHAKREARRLLEALHPGGRIVLQLLSQRRATRTKDAITPVEPMVYYTPDQARWLLEDTGYDEVEVIGMSGYSGPLGVASLMDWESRTLGRWKPGTGYFLIVTGRRIDATA